jgi:hypothetical protein
MNLSPAPPRLCPISRRLPTSSLTNEPPARFAERCFHSSEGRGSRSRYLPMIRIRRTQTQQARHRFSRHSLSAEGKRRPRPRRSPPGRQGCTCSPRATIAWVPVLRSIRKLGKESPRSAPRVPLHAWEDSPWVPQEGAAPRFLWIPSLVPPEMSAASAQQPQVGMRAASTGWGR